MLDPPLLSVQMPGFQTFENCIEFWSPCKERPSLPNLSTVPACDCDCLEIVQTVTRQEREAF